MEVREFSWDTLGYYEGIGLIMPVKQNLYLKVKNEKYFIHLK